ncbi:MAG: transglycosylase SLT domain-containing protein [Alphaproteobacteria bacterium]|nr:transglycosylase SLT domain-containing protein [Alphaproteobacteria bacterium]
MPMQKTFGRGLATSAQLALVAFLSIGFTTTTHDSVANTLSSTKMRVPVVAPSKDDLAAAQQTDRLDKAMGALSLKDAALYRMLFAAQEKQEWLRAEKIQTQISDKRLMGHVLADRYERRDAVASELVEWLKQYPTLPEAGDMYIKAVKAGAKQAPLPQAPEAWGVGEEADVAANFTPELMVDSTAPNSENNAFAKSIRKALRKGDPWGARNLLIKAQSNKKLTGTFAYDVEAVIAAAFFSVGERDQAMSLASAAGGANQPLGLWIKGLISWEKTDLQVARASFTRLAKHPALSNTNCAAAHFWAYRAEKKLGNRNEAKQHLQEAVAAAPHSFYGMLSSQMMGKNPVVRFADTNRQPVWNSDYRFILSDHHAGWRALALIQVGQPAKAEAELRRLSPQGDLDKQQAMLALADYVPMPALALKLAHLSKEGEAGSALYPLLPWQPKEGFQVDRALLFALARQESLFETDAVSARGAQGLMQLMPKTAQGLARGQDRTAKLQPLDTEKLFDPAYNMALGQKYVKYLASLPRIGNNLVLLLAAYNGGPGKTMNWAESRQNTDPLLFLESIPFRETRNYVARVLPHYWAYRARLGKPVLTLRQLAEGKWPSVNVVERPARRIVQAAR